MTISAKVFFMVGKQKTARDFLKGLWWVFSRFRELESSKSPLSGNLESCNWLGLAEEQEEEESDV